MLLLGTISVSDPRSTLPSDAFYWQRWVISTTSSISSSCRSTSASCKSKRRSRSCWQQPLGTRRSSRRHWLCEWSWRWSPCRVTFADLRSRSRRATRIACCSRRSTRSTQSWSRAHSKSGATTRASACQCCVSSASSRRIARSAFRPTHIVPFPIFSSATYPKCSAHLWAICLPSTLRPPPSQIPTTNRSLI